MNYVQGSFSKQLIMVMLALPLILNGEEESPFDVSFSGDLRLRGEVWDSFLFVPGSDDEYLQSRLRVRTHVSHKDSGLELFIEGKSSLITDRDLPGGKRTLDKDPLALQQAWLQLPVLSHETASIVLQAGRQELSYGKQRLVSPLAWSNTGRTWDGARIKTDLADWKIDAFYTWFVPVDSESFNEPDEDHPFYGVYSTHEVNDLPLSYDLYALFDETVASDRQTYGSRIEGSPLENFTFEVEGALQEGDAGSLDVQAWMFASLSSYRPPDCPLSSEWILGYDVSSGDDDPEDGKDKTFHPLFPLGHAFHGYIDALGRRNLTDFHQAVRVYPTETLRIQLAHHFFDRTETEDGVYNAGNKEYISGDSSGSHDIGREIDLTATYAVTLSSSVEAGASIFFAGDVIDDAIMPNDDITFFYLSASATF